MSNDKVTVDAFVCQTRDTGVYDLDRSRDLEPPGQDLRSGSAAGHTCRHLMRTVRMYGNSLLQKKNANANFDFLGAPLGPKSGSGIQV